MPNGGSDHCGNCPHNRVNVGRDSTLDERRSPGYCTIRAVEVRAPSSTYCANYSKNLRVPLGPMFAEHGDRERIPYHGKARPRAAEVARCLVCGAASQPMHGQPMTGVQVVDSAAGTADFCGAPHYVRWWKQVHPGESLRWDADAPPLDPEEARRREIAAMRELAAAFLAAGDEEGARQVLALLER